MKGENGDNLLQIYNHTVYFLFVVSVKFITNDTINAINLKIIMISHMGEI